MSKEIELLTEIRDLLRVAAEPIMAKRDAKARAALRAIVGKSQKKANSVLRMDGSKAQSEIIREAGIDQGDLSRLVKALGKASLIASDEKHPKLTISIPPNFFEDQEPSDE
jgi:hypothetical protein